MRALDGFDRQWAERDWADKVAAAIDSIADQERLTSRDLDFLDALGNQARRAASHATAFLKYWLDHPEQRDRNAKVSQLGMRSALRACVNILIRFPEEAEQAKERAVMALQQPSEPLGQADVVELRKLLEQLR